MARQDYPSRRPCIRRDLQRPALAHHWPGVHHICGTLHSHGANELTVVLRGAHDEMLGHFAPGDAADLDSDTGHPPVTSPGVPCICVAATDAPLRFSRWLARTLQPLFKLQRWRVGDPCGPPEDASLNARLDGYRPMR